MRDDAIAAAIIHFREFSQSHSSSSSSFSFISSLLATTALYGRCDGFIPTVIIYHLSV